MEYEKKYRNDYEIKNLLEDPKGTLAAREGQKIQRIVEKSLGKKYKKKIRFHLTNDTWEKVVGKDLVFAVDGFTSFRTNEIHMSPSVTYQLRQEPTLANSGNKLYAANRLSHELVHGLTAKFRIDKIANTIFDEGISDYLASKITWENADKIVGKRLVTNAQEKYKNIIYKTEGFNEDLAFTVRFSLLMNDGNELKVDKYVANWVKDKKTSKKLLKEFDKKYGKKAPKRQQVIRIDLKDYDKFPISKNLTKTFRKYMVDKYNTVPSDSLLNKSVTKSLGRYKKGSSNFFNRLFSNVSVEIKNRANTNEEAYNKTFEKARGKIDENLKFKVRLRREGLKWDKKRHRFIDSRGKIIKHENIKGDFVGKSKVYTKKKGDYIGEMKIHDIYKGAVEYPNLYIETFVETPIKKISQKAKIKIINKVSEDLRKEVGKQFRLKNYTSRHEAMKKTLDTIAYSGMPKITKNEIIKIMDKVELDLLTKSTRSKELVKVYKIDPKDPKGIEILKEYNPKTKRYRAVPERTVDGKIKYRQRETGEFTWGRSLFDTVNESIDNFKRNEMVRREIEVKDKRLRQDPSKKLREFEMNVQDRAMLLTSQEYDEGYIKKDPNVVLFYRYRTMRDKLVCSWCISMEKNTGPGVVGEIQSNGLDMGPEGIGGLYLDDPGRQHNRCRCVSNIERRYRAIPEVKPEILLPPDFLVPKLERYYPFEKQTTHPTWPIHREYTKYYGHQPEYIRDEMLTVPWYFERMHDKIGKIPVEKPYQTMKENQLIYTHPKSPYSRRIRNLMEESALKGEQMIIYANSQDKVNKLRLDGERFFGRGKVGEYKALFDVSESYKSRRDFDAKKTNLLIVRNPILFKMEPPDVKIHSTGFKDFNRDYWKPIVAKADVIVNYDVVNKGTQANRGVFADAPKVINLFDSKLPVSIKWKEHYGRYARKLTKEMKTLEDIYELYPEATESFYDLKGIDNWGNKVGIKKKKVAYLGDVTLEERVTNRDYKLKRPIRSLFSIQEHHSKKLHNDLRLFIGKGAESFAIPKMWPKGNERILAIKTPLHRRDYSLWEGTLPEKAYGAGEVFVADKGSVEIQGFSPKRVKFSILEGDKRGTYNLLRGKTPEQWFLQKIRRRSLPEQVEPSGFGHRLPTAEMWRDNNNWIAQEKFDGARFLMHIKNNENVFTSRRRSKITGEYIDRSEQVPHLRDLNLKRHSNTIIDGDLYLLGRPLEDLSGIINSNPVKAALKQKTWGKVQYVPFDILKYRGKNISRWPYRERYNLLQRIVKNESNIILPENQLKNKRDFYDKIVKRKGEGIMLKDLEASYGERVIKVKKQITDDLFIIGYEPGEGKYQGQIGSLVLGMWKKTPDRMNKIIEVAKVSGMTDKQRRWLSDNIQRLTRERAVVEVSAIEYTRKGRMRAPQFVRMREDKTDSQVRWEDRARVPDNLFGVSPKEILKRKREKGRFAEKGDIFNFNIKDDKIRKIIKPQIVELAEQYGIPPKKYAAQLEYQLMR